MLPVIPCNNANSIRSGMTAGDLLYIWNRDKLNSRLNMMLYAGWPMALLGSSGSGESPDPGTPAVEPTSNKPSVQVG